MASGSTGADLSSDSYKITLIGDIGVGKTSILLRLVDGIFPSGRQLTEQIGSRKYNLKVDDKMAELNIWDSRTRKRLKDDAYPYLPHYRGVAGIMIVYDSTEEKPFCNLDHWLYEVKLFAKCDFTLMLIENKCDLKSKRQISDQAGEELAAKHGMLFKQTSALDGINIQAAFEDLVRAIRLKRCPDTISITEEPTSTKNKSSCY